jgi:flagellar hook assembly protein FlgD
VQFVLTVPPACGAVKLAIHDVSGRLVKTVAGVAEGTHTLRWDGLNATGRRAATGVYFARVTTERESVSRRVILLTR